uniref:K Homology domain-containing protein n=1 Tax=Meloidogyne enterolobii TaxID=390850 RepID=A0A6V7VK18_MELEN|nr:unnamed protein product [Meloidogyne enterolobii]
MNQINENIKKNKFSIILGDQIYEICTELRIKGKELEKTNKDDLDKFFSSIRLASCREDGELGLPCRIKILELLEIRLMGWRNNLSHARYYARKERELEELKNENLFINTFQSKTNSCTSSTNSISPKFINNNNEINNLYSKQNFVSNKNSPQSPQQQHRPLSIDNSASDFHSTIPLFPAQFNIPPPSLPPPTCLIDPTVDNNTGMARPASFFFIPSQTGTFVPVPPAITGFNPTENLGMFSSPPPPFKFIPPNFFKENNSLNNTNRNINVAEYGVSEFELLQPKIKSTPNLFREEIQIRNSDSGKVMGVKGRRVALIEELSNTVISFQKVDPKCQNRQLTIIAEAQNAIENAKSLIAETIERNISPNRKVFKHEEDKIISIPPGDKKNKMVIKEQFKIIRENEGSLKIASNDAALLNLAQEAVNECLKQISVKAITTYKSPQNQLEDKEIKSNSETTLSNKESKYVYDRDAMMKIRKMVQNSPSILAEASQQLLNNDLDILCL